MSKKISVDLTDENAGALYQNVVNVSTMPDPITEDDIDAIAKLETEGRRLLKQLAAANN